MQYFYRYVLILVVLDDALVLFVFLLVSGLLKVLILVVLDDALVRQASNRRATGRNVLILVVLDDALVPLQQS